MRGSTTKARSSILRSTLEVLTRILFCADGLTRSKSVGGEAYHFRAAASAGALYPIEIYLAATEVEALEPGLYHFSPADLKLRGLRRGDWREYLARTTAAQPALTEARAILVLSAIFWRSTWKYRARAFRYCFWDAGTILANLLAAANAEGLTAEIITAFEDAPVERLIDVDGEREGCRLPGRPRPQAGAMARSAGQAPSTPLTPLELETVPLSQDETAYDDLTKIHRASRLESSAEVRAVASATLPVAPALATTESIVPAVLPQEDATGLGETILRRGSTRVFARDSIDAAELATIMATAKAPLHLDFPSMVEAYLIVNAVDGIAPGAYYYRRECRKFRASQGWRFSR